MNYVNFNNFQPSSANTFSKEDARVAILMVETKNPKAAEKMVANLDETNNQLKDIVALVENKLAILDALKVARANNEFKALNEAYEAAKAENLESFEFKGQTFKVINESKEEQVEEKFRYTEDDINTLYGFYGTLETNFKKKDVERMYTEGVDGLMKAYKISEKVAIAILDSKVGRHMADMIYSKIATDAVDALAKYFGSGARVWNYITSMIRLEESLMTEAGDHEVGMANGQLADIVKNAQELMSKIGTTEKDIPGWIQDHISQAQNYINQANSNYHELEESVDVNEAWIGPFQFNDKMSDEELKKMYDDALNGYANWQKGLTHPKSDYKKAYQEIAKILKARGVKVDESVEEALKSDSPNDVITIDLDMAWDPADEKEAKAAFKKYKIKVDGTGEPGTYEVTGKKKDILAYLQSEFYEMEDETIEEYYPELLESYGSGMGLSKVQTKKVAETLAKAISKHDGVNCTVNAKTLEEDSFDLDIDGELGAAGSYNIYDDGSVVNHAVTPNEIYGNYKSTVEEFIRGLKKPIYESVTTNEAKEIEVSLRYARLANDVFDDMYRRLGKKTSTNTFKMNSDDLADDFTQSLLDAGIPQEEIYEGWRPMTDEEKAEKQRKDQQLKRLRAADKKSADSKRLRDLQTKMHQDRLKKSNK